VAINFALVDPHSLSLKHIMTDFMPENSFLRGFDSGESSSSVSNYSGSGAQHALSKWTNQSNIHSEQREGHQGCNQRDRLH
jgi:hypothetical protein